jgi:N-terminal acetyltransferase B complex non-catalytic subunit
MKPVLFKLAHRLLTNLSPRALQASVDRGYLYLDVVSELELWDEADAFLNSELGQLFCSNSLHCDELRRKTQQTRGLWKQEGDLAKQRIQEKK